MNSDSRTVVRSWLLITAYLIVMAKGKAGLPLALGFTLRQGGE